MPDRRSPSLEIAWMFQLNSLDIPTNCVGAPEAYRRAHLMFIACVVVTVLLSLALLGSAAAKLTKQPKLVAQLTGIGVGESQLPQLAVLEIAGAIGMLAGLKFAGLGVLAGICLILFFAGAVIAHLRAHDKDIAGALVLGLLTAIAVGLRLATF